MPLQTNEPKRLGEFSPEFVKDELGLINQVRTERKGELSDYIAAERPQLKRPEGIPNELDLVRQVMAGRKKEAPVVKERGALGEFAAGFGRGVLGVVAAPAEIADVAGEAIGWEALEKAGEAGAKAVEKYIEESPKLKRTESISKNILKNPELWKDPRWYSSIVGEGLPTILSMLVPGMAAAKAAKAAKLGAKGVRAARIAGGLSAGVGLEAAGAASDIRHHEEQTGEAIPISTKLQSVLGTGIVAGSLEYVPIFAIFGKTGAKKLVGRVLSGMAMEGTTEGAQGLIANAFAKAGYDADRNMVDGVVESIVGGVLLGGGMGAVSRVTNFKERVDETNPDEVSDILEQVEKETKITPEKTIELTEAEKRQAAIDREFEARRTPAERQAEIEAAMPATPMTTISEETTKLAEEGIKPEVVEPVPEEIVPEEIPLAPEAMPATMRAMGMRPVSVEPIVEKPVVEEKIVEPEAPKIEIPTLTDTTQAIAFGEKATPEQITELKRLRKESETRYDVLVKEDKLDEAGEEAFKVQLYREAYEAKEKPKKPVVEKPKVAPEVEKPWEQTSKFMIEVNDTFGLVTAQIAGRIKDKDLSEKIKKVPYFKEAERAAKKYVEDLPSIGTVDQEMLHYAMARQAISKGESVPKEVLAEYPDLAPAKPPTPRPPKPTPPEAVREEIEVEPIPEVAPKVEKKEIIEKLKKKEFYGTIDRLERGEITLEKAKNELKDVVSKEEKEAQKKYDEGLITLDQYQSIITGRKIKTTELNPADYAAELKGEGIGRRESWSEWIKKTTLKPGMDAKDWYKIYDAVKPIPKVEAPVEKVPAKPEPGFAWIKGKQKPILSARKITKGKHEGKYEIILTKGRDEEGNVIPGAKKIVTEKEIITMPEEKVKAPLKKEPTKAKPFEPDLKTLPLSDINVKVKAIKESTGEIITVDENAKVAIESNEKEIEKFYELLACL